MPLILFILLAVFAFAIGFYGYVELKKDWTRSLYFQRKLTASIAATMLRERLSGLVDVSVLLAGMVDVREHIEAGEWDEAVKHIGLGFLKSGVVDHVFIADPMGTFRADTPPSPELIGQNFAWRDWYKGVSKEKNGSLMFPRFNKRKIIPEYNVVAVTVPIKNVANSVIGILVLQVKLDTFLEWTKEITVGSKGFVYFVDQRGQIVANPTYPSQEEIIDYSAVQVVQRVLAGESGADVFFNPIEKEDRLSAFGPVAEYGWGVVVQQDVIQAFAMRDRDLKVLLAAYIFMAIFFITIFFYTTRLINGLRKREELIESQKKALLDKEELEKFYKAVASAGEHIIITDFDGKIIYANKAAEEITGYSMKEMLGQTPRLWGGLMPREFYEKMWKTIKEDKKPFRGEIQNKKKNGQLYFANTRISPVLDENGNAKFFVGIERDISEEKALEKARADLLTLASHQLRTPLSGTKWLIETLRRGVLGRINKKQVAYLD